MFTLLNVYELKFKKNTIPYNVRHVHVYTIALKSTSHSGKKMWYNIESKWTFIIKSIKNQRSLIIKTRNKSLKLLIKKNEQEKKHDMQIKHLIFLITVDLNIQL